MKCFECGTEMKVSRETRRDKESGLPNVTLKNVEVRRCLACGAEDVVIPRIEELHRLLAKALLHKPGRLTGPEVRYLRKYLGWSSEDFAACMGVVRETISRWENGHEPMSPQAERLLRLAVAHEQPIEDYRVRDLCAVDQGQDEPAWVTASLVERKWELATAVA
ncbi:MAG: type II TA system antitoxin MqsA family protein [Planctomycetota bacterium]